MIEDFLADGQLREREENLVENRRKGGLRGFLKRLAVGIGVIVLVLATVGFFARGWLLERGEQLLTDGLAKRGYFVAYEKARLHPTRGVVLEGLTLFETEARKKPVLSLSDVGVKIGWGKLIRQRSLEGLTPEVSIRSGVLEAVSGEERLTFSEMVADLEIGSGGIDVERANLRFEGLDLRASGAVKFQPKEKKEPAGKIGNGEREAEKEKQKKGLPDLAPLMKLKEWVAIEAEGAAPVLAVQFAVDPKSESPVSAEGTISGEAFSWRKFPVDRLDAAFAYGGTTPAATVSRLELGYRGGLLTGQGLAFSPGTGKAVIGRLLSRVDWVRMLGELPFEGPAIPETIEITGAPEIEMAGEIFPKELGRSAVTVRIEHPPGLRVKAGEKWLEVTEISGQAALRDGVLRTDGLEMGIFDGSVRVTGESAVFDDPMSYQGRVELAEADLDELLPLAGIEGAMESSLALSMDVSGSTELKTIAAKGVMTVKGPDLAINAPVSLEAGVARVTGMTAELGGGEVLLSAAANVLEKTFPFAVDLRSEAVPVSALAKLGGQNAEEALATALTDHGVELLGAPVITVKGSGSAAGLKAADLAIGFEDAAGMRITMPDRPPLTASGISGTGTLRNGLLETPGVNVRVFGGGVKVTGKSAVLEEPITYQSRIEAGGIAFEELMAFVGRDGVYPSKLGMAMDVSGGTALPAIAAKGTVTLAGDGLEVNAPISLAQGVVTTEGLQANVGGGRVALNAAADLVKKPLAFQADLQTEQVPIQKLLDVAGVEQQFAGNLTAAFKGSGTAELAALNGTGSVRIDDGALYRIPVLGKVKDALAKRAPMFEREAPANLAATLVIENGVVATEDLTIVSDLTGVEAAGVFDLGRMWTRFTAQAKVKAGLVSAATNPISKLLEVKGEGPVDDLKIGLSNLDPLTAVGNVKDTIGATREGLKDTAGMARDAVNGAKNLGEGGLKGLADKVIKAGTGETPGESKPEGGEPKKEGEGLRRLLPNRQQE